jgi:hypothetical protein
MAREPGFLGGERQQRREPANRRPEDVIEGGERGLARRRRDRVAVENIMNWLSAATMRL